MAWGVYDTQDGLWLGDDTGPRVFAVGDPLPDGKVIESDEVAHFLARCAAEATCFTLQWEPTRARAQEMPEETAWTFRDELTKSRTALEWLDKKERGVIP